MLSVRGRGIASLCDRIRKPLSIEVRIPEEGVIVSTGELRSGESGVRKLFRLVWDVASASFDEEDDCFVDMRSVG